MEEVVKTQEKVRGVSRRVTYHTTALAKGTPDESALIRSVFQGAEHQLLTDGVDVMLPVGVAYSALKGSAEDDAAMREIPGFATLLDFLEQLHRDKVSWLVLDTKPMSMER
jgi:hypothetical protein